LAGQDNNYSRRFDPAGELLRRFQRAVENAIGRFGIARLELFPGAFLERLVTGQGGFVALLFAARGIVAAMKSFPALRQFVVIAGFAVVQAVTIVAKRHPDRGHRAIEQAIRAEVERRRRAIHVFQFFAVRIAVIVVVVAAIAGKLTASERNGRNQDNRRAPKQTAHRCLPGLVPNFQ
jgi:hypothetical protein